MEHSIPQPLDLAHPWRTRAIIAGAVAAVELVALLVAGIVLVAPALGRHMRHAATVKALAPAAPRKHTAKPKQPTLSRSETSVLVLNGNSVQGAASREASLLQSAGYRVVGAENAERHDYARSMVLYVPGWIKEARRLAHDTGIRLVAPVDGLRPAALKGSKTVVILGSS